MISKAILRVNMGAQAVAALKDKPNSKVDITRYSGITVENANFVENESKDNSYIGTIGDNQSYFHVIDDHHRFKSFSRLSYKIDGGQEESAEVEGVYLEVPADDVMDLPKYSSARNSSVAARLGGDKRDGLPGLALENKSNLRDYGAVGDEVDPERQPLVHRQEVKQSNSPWSSRCVQAVTAVLGLVVIAEAVTIGLLMKSEGNKESNSVSPESNFAKFSTSAVGYISNATFDCNDYAQKFQLNADDSNVVSFCNQLGVGQHSFVNLTEAYTQSQVTITCVADNIPLVAQTGAFMNCTGITDAESNLIGNSDTLGSQLYRCNNPSSEQNPSLEQKNFYYSRG